MADGEDGAGRAVLEVARRDFVDLVPVSRPRGQSLRGFDPVYTDIVDYIVRCTHRIWDERDVGLIYTHYAHNAVMYGALTTLYDREAVVHDTIQRIAEMPDRRAMATQVVWSGNDVDGFYTSHLLTSTGRHTEPGRYGRPTGRRFATRTVADCRVFENRIYREWLVRDSMAVVQQLGLDAHALAAQMARDLLDRGMTAVEIAENGRAHGQYPPPEDADTSLARSETEAWCLRWMHQAYNRRMFGVLREVYAPNVQWHGPPMRELFGRAAVLHQVLRLFAMLTDASFVPQHVCSNATEEGGELVAVRWIIDGHHLGWGTLGAPTGQRVCVMGMTHLRVVDHRIVDDWTVYDELAMLTQVKLGQMQATPGLMPGAESRT